jgi:hypothetical protein
LGYGGSIFWKTPDIGFSSYSIIPLPFEDAVEKRLRREAWERVAEGSQQADG